jgi:PKHD-type hydroxylase
MSDSVSRPSSPSVLGPFVVLEGVFTAAELDAIARHCGRLRHQPAALTGNSAGYDGSIRRTEVAWLERNAQTDTFYRQMEEIVLHLNRQFFQFELSGLAPIQYAIYEASQQAHFDWHTDYGREQGHETHEPRKLSLSLQLSEPGDYQGGELEAQVRSRIEVAPKTRGALIAFASYVLHRVTPVTSGVRKSLVIWASGPEYR